MANVEDRLSDAATVTFAAPEFNVSLSALWSAFAKATAGQLRDLYHRAKLVGGTGLEPVTAGV